MQSETAGGWVVDEDVPLDDKKDKLDKKFGRSVLPMGGQKVSLWWTRKNHKGKKQYYHNCD